MLYVCYIELQNLVILLRHMLGFTYQHHGAAFFKRIVPLLQLTSGIIHMPICSIYGIFTNTCPESHLNVDIPDIDHMEVSEHGATTPNHHVFR